jgi:hypothetical protein
VSQAPFWVIISVAYHPEMYIRHLFALSIGFLSNGGNLSRMLSRVKSDLPACDCGAKTPRIGRASCSRKVRETAGNLALLPRGLRVGNAPARKVIQKLRNRIDSRYQQMIARPRTCDIQEMALSVIDLFEVGVIRGGFDALL